MQGFGRLANEPLRVRLVGGVEDHLAVIETAVLREIGAGHHLLSKEQAAAVKERGRKIVCDADTGKFRIEMIRPPDGSARDEAEATDRRAGTE